MGHNYYYIKKDKIKFPLISRHLCNTFNYIMHSIASFCEVIPTEFHNNL